MGKNKFSVFWDGDRNYSAYDYCRMYIIGIKKEMMLMNLYAKIKLKCLERDLQELEDIAILSIFEDGWYEKFYRKALGEDRYICRACKKLTRAEHLRDKIEKLGGTVRQTIDCECCGKIIYEL